jgi:protein O-mannosyl-transferase
MKKPYYYCILVALCFLAYANTLQNAFVFDDLETIVKNPHIGRFSPYIFNPPDLLYSLNFLLGHFQPLVYHLTNILIHTAATLLVFLFLQTIFAASASCAGAALFAVLPIHTEAVTWISGRPYALMGVSILVVYLLYYYSNACEKKRRLKQLIMYSASLIIYGYYMVSNIAFLIAVPALIIASDLLFGSGLRTWKKWIPFIAIAGVRLLLAHGLIMIRVQSVAGDTGLNVWTNPFYNIAYCLWWYARLSVWPAQLTLFHEPNILPVYNVQAGIIFVGLLGALMVYAYKHSKELFFAAFLFILFLAPSFSPVVVCSLVAERYSYFASIGLSIACAYMYTRFMRFERSHVKRRFFLVLFGMVLSLYTVRTIVRNSEWKDSYTLWQATARVSPLSHRAHNNFGEACMNAGLVKQAILEFQKAYSLNGRNINALNNLAVALQIDGHNQEALATFKKALTISGGWFTAYYNLGNFYMNTGNLQEALNCFLEAVQRKPDFAEAYNNAGHVYDVLGDRQRAIEMFSKAERVRKMGVEAEAEGR